MELIDSDTLEKRVQRAGLLHFRATIRRLHRHL